MADEIRRLLADELGEGCEESWERVTDDPDIRCVTVGKITLGEFPYWSVGVAVAEFLRADPLESELRQQMAAALRAVDGAERVWEDDREIWGVTGAVSGGALVRAAAGVVDRLADRARSYLASRG
jgi:hypothetical protein